MTVIITCFESTESFGPLTRFRPMALLPVLNAPLLQHHIELCVSRGLKDIHVVVVDHPVAVRSFVGDGARWGAKISVSTFKDSCSGQEAMKLLADKTEGPVVLLPVENFFDFDLMDLLAFHDSHDRKVTKVLCATGLDADSKFDDESAPLVTSALPEPVDSGVRVADSPADVAEPAEAMTFGGAWVRIESPRSLWAANTACLAGRFPSLTNKLNARREGDVWFGHHTSVDASSVIKGPALIGDFASVRPEARIGPYSAIGNSAIIDKGAHVRFSLIFDHAYVGAQTSVENSIAAGNHILNMRIGSWVAVTDPFLISNVQEKLVIPWTAQLFGKGVAAVMLFLTFPIWFVKGLVRTVAGKPFFDRESVLEFGFSADAAGLARGMTFERLVFHDSRNLISRLPGLIDVIRGRLALVGVRPLEEIDELTYAEDWAKQRFDAPAGLFTPVDAERMNEALEEEKVIAENLYVANRSVREDVKVLVKAIRNLMFNRG